LFLDELKFQTNAALNLRISLERTNVPAVKAVLGQTGIVEGTDYRGEPGAGGLACHSEFAVVSGGAHGHRRNIRGQ